MYEILFYVGIILAGIFFVLAIVFFVKDHIAKIIGDLTGWNAKKEIKKMNQKGVQAVAKKEMAIAQREEIIVKDVELSGEMIAAESMIDEEETVLLSEEETTLLAEEETTLLDSEETILLTEEETELLVAEEETILLTQKTELLDSEETTLLYAKENLSKEDGYSVEEHLSMPSIFEVEEDSVIVHTDESI